MEGQRFPEPTVGALIFNPEGKLLLIKSRKWLGKYVVPGGHIELGERLEDAVRREIKEETGLDVRDVRFFSMSEFIFDPSFHRKRHFIFLDFTCKSDSSEVRLNDEAQGFVWATPEEALKLPLEPYTLPLIEKLLGRKPPKDDKKGRCRGFPGRLPPRGRRRRIELGTGDPQSPMLASYTTTAMTR